MNKQKDRVTFEGLQKVLTAIADEKATKMAALDDLQTAVLDAVSHYEANRVTLAHERIRFALDVANEELGSTEDLELLAAALDYEGPDPGDEPLG